MSRSKTFLQRYLSILCHHWLSLKIVFNPHHYLLSVPQYLSITWFTIQMIAPINPQIILYKLCNKRFGANLKYYPVCTCLPMSCLFTASFNVSLSPIRYYEATILCVKVSLSKLTDCKQIKCAVPQVCYDGQGYVSRITIIQQLSSRLSEALVQYPYLLFSFIHLNYAV